MSERQWLRECSLIVGDRKGSGLDLSALRIKFATKKGDIETPNSAEISVYNLSDETAARIRSEFTQVILSAGYQGAAGVIFRGSIRQVRIARDGAVDRVLMITAADGDRAYNFATMNRTLAAGARPADQVNACMGSFKDKGVSAGYVPDLGGQPLPRGKVMYGMTRAYMRQAGDNTDSVWSIQDGQAQMVPAKSYLPGEAVVLTAETGLIGTPEQTNEGIKVCCLLNPRLRISGRIKLDNASIAEMKKDLKLGAINKTPKLDKDGFYRILKAEFTGDTHGADWFADLLCIGIDQISMTTLDRL